MTFPGLLTGPPDDDPYLPVLNDLSVSGYCDFQSALSQARSMAAMNQHDADDPNLPDDERQFAARTAISQQATIQLFAALIGDRTELDTLAALDDQTPNAIPGSWGWTPAS